MKSLLVYLALGLVLLPAAAWAQTTMRPIRTTERIFDQDGPVYMNKSGNAPIAPAQGTRQDPKPSMITNWNVPGAKLVRYDGLDLKIISGTSERRLATINNQTFLPGETLKVIVRGSNVQVRCLEIRDRSVLVKVQGEEAPRELKLQAWQ